MVKKVLFGDIGGTHSNFALVNVDSKNNFKILLKKSFLTQSKNSFEELINLFLEEVTEDISIGVFAVAGKIEENSVKMTNTDFFIDSKEIIKNTQLKKVELINDFTALSYSIEVLPKEDIIQINTCPQHNTKPKIVLGAGTGLGKSIMTFNTNSKKYEVNPSEGGHNPFSIENKEELKLSNFIKKYFKKEIVEEEDILSGRGLEVLYSYLKKYNKEYSKYFQNLSAEEISKNKKTNKCAKHALDLFYFYFAKIAKAFTLETLSEGGVYLAGGIISKNLNFNKKIFLKEFENHPEFKDLLKNTPVYIIKNYDSSIYGLINYYSIFYLNSNH